jgi:hypothetical protein
MTDEFTGVLCQSIDECQAVLADVDVGSISTAEALKRLRIELSRQELLRAMWDAGYLPQDTPPPVVVANN